MGAVMSTRRAGFILDCIWEEEKGQKEEILRDGGNAWAMTVHSPTKDHDNNKNIAKNVLRVKILSLTTHSLSLRRISPSFSLYFHPPSRERDRLPVKLNNFLRAQKVPLHQRREGVWMVCCCSRERDKKEVESDDIVAVFVEGQSNGDMGNEEGRWIVDAMYDDVEENDGEVREIWLQRQ